MTSTVLRVKRRLEESPQDALVLLCKKLKTEQNEAAELAPSVFVFHGTIKDQENIDTHVKKLWPKPESKDKPASKNITEIIDKIRKEHKENVNESRYEIISYSRGLKAEVNENTEDGKDYALVDVARKLQEEEKDVKFAYDLYFAHKHEFDVSMLDDVVRIDECEMDLVYGTLRDNGRRTPSSSEESSDDSNDENNWRNEYPDTDKSSIDEEDMAQAIQDCNIGTELSSDTGEDDIYNDPAVPDLNPEDVQRYGAAYAKYKVKVLAKDTGIEDKSNLISCTKVKDLDEEDVEGYKDKDEDDGFYYGQDEDSEQFVSQYKHEESDSDYAE